MNFLTWAFVLSEHGYAIADGSPQIVEHDDLDISESPRLEEQKLLAELIFTLRPRVTTSVF
jgi:hypothetical protein